MSRAVASAAAAHAHHAARQEALAALKAALAAQSTTAAAAPSTTGETGKAEGESVESGDSRAATGASATSNEGARAAKSVVPTTAAVAGPQAGDRAAGIDSGSDHAGEGGSKRRGQEPPADVPAPVRLSGSHSSQAIAAFQAAAMAGAGASSAAREAVASGGGTFGRALLDAELPASIVHSVHLQAAKGGGEARISLNPGFLGQMTVGVQVDGASVVASLHASNADVRDWIRTNEAMLRQALAEQGFNLERLVVIEEETADASGEQSPHEQDDHEQRPRRQPRTAAQGSFEALI